MAAKNTSTKKSVMAHQFSQVPQAKVQRSSFNRSHVLKTTFDAGLLVPIFIDEVLPGDTHNLRASLFGRLATPLKPVMDSLFLETFFFFVPTRLVWSNWQRFNGEQYNPDDSTDFTVPTVTLSSVGTQTLYDYMGVPAGQATNLEVNALPFRAYHLIWNEWFRDQNLQDSKIVPIDDGPDVALYGVHRRGKRHDYFSSALPWPQKGPSSVVSIGGNAPVGTSAALGAVPGQPALFHDLSNPANRYAMQQSGPGIDWSASAAGSGHIFADLSQATAVTINELREAFQIQKLLERDARGGTRYTEIIRSHFGVTSPDARLQRPEFLGGGSSMININPVAQTSETNPAASPQGNLAAFGTVSAQGHGFTKSFTEHGYIIGLVNVRADLTYQQGLHRLWSRRGRYDFYWPALAHLGEQAILNKEIYVLGDNGTSDDEVFGYQERYAEYRYKPSLITGKFRSGVAGSLDVWHYGQDFANLPVLGEEFIEDNPPIARTLAVQDEPQFLLDCYFNLRSVRPMPMYGVPGLIDHF